MTVNFDERSLRGTPGLAALNETHDLRQALCTSAFLPDKESFLFVSLFRSAEARPFEDRDVRLKQAVTPHLYASWRTNLLFAMARGEESSRARNHAAGFVDRTGRIVCADANFAVMVAEGWPSWSGACVPRALLQGDDRAPGASARFRSRRRPVGGLLLLELDRVSPLQDLTPREREIALEYSSARSYKEIARDLGIAPATVRHHLRVIFDKLGIGTKAELVRLVDCAGAMPLAPSGTVPIDCLGGGAD